MKQASTPIEEPCPPAADVENCALRRPARQRDLEEGAVGEAEQPLSALPFPRGEHRCHAISAVNASFMRSILPDVERQARGAHDSTVLTSPPARFAPTPGIRSIDR